MKKKKEVCGDEEVVADSDDDDDEIVEVLPPVEKKKLDRREWRSMMLKQARERHERKVREKVAAAWAQGMKKEGDDDKNGVKEEMVGHIQKEDEVEAEESDGAGFDHAEGQEIECTDEDIDEDEDEEAQEERFNAEEDLDEEELLRRLKEKEDRKLQKQEERRRKKLVKKALKASEEAQEASRETLISKDAPCEGEDEVQAEERKCAGFRGALKKADSSYRGSSMPLLNEDSSRRKKDPFPFALKAASKTCDLIEAEAEIDDEDNGEDQQEGIDEIDENPECANENIEVGQTQPVDPNEMRAFHLQWRQTEDQKVVSRIQLKGASTDDVIEEEDMNRPLTAQKDEMYEKSGNPQLTEEGEGSMNGEFVDQRDRSNVDASVVDAHGSYVEDMFKIKDSSVLFGSFGDEESHDAAAEENDDARRLKAKALWKARRRNKLSRGGSELSMLNNCSKEALESRKRFREQIEQAITMDPEKTSEIGAINFSGLSTIKARKPSRKDAPKASEVLSEWEKRRLCLRKVEEKRKNGPSLTLWSANLASKAKKSKKSRREPSKSDPTILQTGSLNGVHRKRKRGTMTITGESLSSDVKVDVEHAPKRKKMKAKTTFKGLFKVLAGSEARNDWA